MLLKNKKLIIFLVLIVMITTLFILEYKHNNSDITDIKIKKSYFTLINSHYFVINNREMYSTEKKLSEFSVEKFANNLKSYFKTSDKSQPANSHFATTKDGVDWYYSGIWTKDKKAYSVIIYYDVNGEKNAPNCTQHTSFPRNHSVCKEDTIPDTYAVGFRDDSNMTIFPKNQTHMLEVLLTSPALKKTEE